MDNWAKTLPYVTDAITRTMLRNIFVAGLIALFVAPAEAEQPVAIFSQAVSLDSRGPSVLKAGQLTYRGGIVLRSPELRFGGFSALHVSADGSTALAISDRGAWLRFRLRYDAGDHLVGASDARMGVLIGENGKALMFLDTDAEALAVLPDGSMLIAFERDHRILHYPAASPPFSKTPVRRSVPAAIKNAPANFGLEALAHIGEGRLVTYPKRWSRLMDHFLLGSAVPVHGHLSLMCLSSDSASRTLDCCQLAISSCSSNPFSAARRASAGQARFYRARPTRRG